MVKYPAMFPSSEQVKLSQYRKAPQTTRIQSQTCWRVARIIHLEGNSKAESAWNDGNYLDYLLATDDTINVYWNESGHRIWEIH